MRYLLLATVLIAGCAQPHDARIQVLIGGVLEDGRGGARLEHPVVVIEDGKIAAVGSQTHVPVPRGSAKIDTTDYVIRPAQGNTIEAGKSADLELVDKSGVVSRKMVRGLWE